MAEEWKRPPPKLVKKKRKFLPLIAIIIVSYFIAVFLTWVISGGWLPLQFIMIIWLFLIIFVFLVLFTVWWITS